MFIFLEWIENAILKHHSYQNPLLAQKILQGGSYVRQETPSENILPALDGNTCVHQRMQQLERIKTYSAHTGI